MHEARDASSSSGRLHALYHAFLKLCIFDVLSLAPSLGSAGQLQSLHCLTIGS